MPIRAACSKTKRGAGRGVGWERVMAENIALGASWSAAGEDIP